MTRSIKQINNRMKKIHSKFVEELNELSKEATEILFQKYSKIIPYEVEKADYVWWVTYSDFHKNPCNLPVDVSISIQGFEESFHQINKANPDYEKANKKLERVLFPKGDKPKNVEISNMDCGVILGFLLGENNEDT